MTGREDYFDVDEGSELDEYKPDVSDKDLSYDALDENETLSKLSLKKSSKSDNGGGAEKWKLFGGDEKTESSEVEFPDLTERDEKCFKKVEEIIRAGKLASLNVEQCKVYLRKFGLRLSGKKSVLIERIKEHLEIVDGAGDKRYPASSFILNCKGDACTGDVVMFEQNVYEAYSVASRSATGPPCGTRIVAGRIVKESYGAAKQQHTFTIEVLWSKGEKPLPPLCPLLIKGRNLYRLKTMRQRWANEEERRKVLLEKHMRGSHARLSRETRIQKRETRKKLGARTKKEEERIIIPEERAQQQQQNPIQCDGIRKADLILQRWYPNIKHGNDEQQDPIHTLGNKQPSQKEVLTNTWTRSHKQPKSFPCGDILQPNIQKQRPTVLFQKKVLPQQQIPFPFKENLHQNIQPQLPAVQGGNCAPLQQRTLAGGSHYYQVSDELVHPFLHGRQAHVTCFQQSHREPMKVANDHGWAPRSKASQRQVCPFYPRGTCWYGGACKYVHEQGLRSLYE